jgi:hypothetical protein
MEWKGRILPSFIFTKQLSSVVIKLWAGTLEFNAWQRQKIFPSSLRSRIDPNSYPVDKGKAIPLQALTGP